MNRPDNLFVDVEPDYCVTVRTPDGHVFQLQTSDTRNQWKRLSAICHARHYARRNPTHSVMVQIIK